MKLARGAPPSSSQLHRTLLLARLYAVLGIDFNTYGVFPKWTIHSCPRTETSIGARVKVGETAAATDRHFEAFLTYLIKTKQQNELDACHLTRVPAEGSQPFMQHPTEHDTLSSLADMYRLDLTTPFLPRIMQDHEAGVASVLVNTPSILYSQPELFKHVMSDGEFSAENREEAAIWHSQIQDIQRIIRSNPEKYQVLTHHKVAPPPTIPGLQPRPSSQFPALHDPTSVSPAKPISQDVISIAKGDFVVTRPSSADQIHQPNVHSAARPSVPEFLDTILKVEPEQTNSTKDPMTHDTTPEKITGSYEDYEDDEDEEPLADYAMSELP